MLPLAFCSSVAVYYSVLRRDVARTARMSCQDIALQPSSLC